MATKIGLMVGREWSFPPAFIEEVNGRDAGIEVEYVKLATPRLVDPLRYQVIVDRISHAVPFYRAYLKHAMLRGVKVLNDPFISSLEDRFTAFTVASELGIALPRTVALPHREYAEGIVHEESLRNLDYPLDWQAVVEYVGLPCVLKEAMHGAEYQYVCHSLEELLQRFNASGQRLLLVQEMIQWQQYVRCFVIGREDVLPIKYDPWERRYQLHHEHLTPELGRTVVDESLRLVRALGYDMNTVDWAIRDGVPHAVEFTNPVPEIDIYALTEHYFGWVVKRLADTAIRAVEAPVSRHELRWPLWEAGQAAPREVTPGTKARRVGEGVGDLAEELPSLARDLPRSEV